jgi:hypothetical protein
VITQASGQCEEVPTPVTESLSASDESACDMLRKPQVGGGISRYYMSAALLKRMLLPQVMNNLLDKQRVSLRRLIYGGHKLMRRTFQAHALNQLVNL